MIKIKSLLCFVFSFFLIFSLYGCQDEDFVNSTYKTLAVSQVIYDNTFQVLAEMYKTGQITEETKETAIKYGYVYYESFIITRNALEEYAKEIHKGNEPSEGQRTMLNIFLAETVRKLYSLVELVEMFYGDLPNPELPVSDEVNALIKKEPKQELIEVDIVEEVEE